MAHRKKAEVPDSFYRTEWKDRLPVLKFVLFFFVLAVLFYLLTNGTWFDRFREPFLVLFTSVSSAILNVFGYQTTAQGSQLSSAGFGVNIREGCDALAPAILFTVAVLAFPGAWKKKIPGILVGLLAIFVLNLVRIISLYLAGIYVPDWFDFLHVEFWQVIFIALTVLVWLIWLRWSQKPPVPA